MCPRLGRGHGGGLEAGFIGYRRGRHDLFALTGVRGQDAMVSHQVEARRRHQGGEFLYQLQGREQQVGGAIWNHLTMHLLCTVRRMQPV